MKLLIFKVVLTESSKGRKFDKNGFEGQRVRSLPINVKKFKGKPLNFFSPASHFL